MKTGSDRSGTTGRIGRKACAIACALALACTAAPAAALAEASPLAAGAVSTQGVTTQAEKKVVYTTPKSPKKVISSGNVAVKALYSKASGDWMYTTSASEVKKAKAAGYTDKGMAWAASKKGKAVYQLTSPSGRHCYTTSKAKRDAKKAAGWKTKVAFRSATSDKTTPVYAVKSGSSTKYTTKKASGATATTWLAVKATKKYRTVEHAATKVRVKSTGDNYYVNKYDANWNYIGKVRVDTPNPINKKTPAQIIAMVDDLLPWFKPPALSPTGGWTNWEEDMYRLNKVYMRGSIYRDEYAAWSKRDTATLKKLRRDLVNQVYTHKYNVYGKTTALGDTLYWLQDWYESLIEGAGDVRPTKYVDIKLPVDAYTEKVLYYRY